MKNETQFNLLLIDTFFDSGRYWTAPGGTGSFTQMVYSCCNGDNTVGTGATGGTAFRLSLDDKHYFDISLVSMTPTIHEISWEGSCEVFRGGRLPL